MFQILHLIRPVLRNSLKKKFNFANDLFNSNIFLRNYAIGKFYKTTNIVENNGSYGVLLDNSKLKTPLGKEMIINSKALALAVAEEWNLQEKSIQTDSMHLTKLCYLSVDNPNEHCEKDIAQQILSYLETDTVFFISDNDKDLEKLLNEKWLPIINNFNKYFETNLKPSKGIYINCLDAYTKKMVEKYLLSLGFPALHGVLQAVETLKSLILTICCLHQDITVNDAVLLSKLEEEYQCTKWGRVDWIKDYSDTDSVIRLSAAMLFIYYTLNPKHKPMAKKDIYPQIQQSLKQ
ncbi:ATP synthase mitochondrial F1 complex assembly factor 2 [Daktulosphaira vitifoliae]|uniref:ATP synthase mitochondrial F1 complex assembly factor 2 n=1 Tax=Daktulosphaira vitifoliae TaxID=58002 RepID=UPI0021A9D9E8|nr:ATP synthase mitochondrial F1 complex assembly factor 2 [Daktulosphaira vitifoliae]XP_050530577.1 ATP synthase mitochondrial F1 complex assembly factor 2 [Daktulosphaira vitifoliae]